MTPQQEQSFLDRLANTVEKISQETAENTVNIALLFQTTKALQETVNTMANELHADYKRGFECRAEVDAAIQEVSKEIAKKSAVDNFVWKLIAAMASVITIAMFVLRELAK